MTNTKVKPVDVTGWNLTETLLFEEVMSILRVKSKDPIYRLLAAGELKAYSPHGVVGKKGIRILTQSLKDHIKKNTLPSDAFNV